MTCVCGLEPNTEECCGKYLNGTAVPPTPEALMRSRYAAYVLDKIDYIVETHNPAAREEVDPEGAREWSRAAEWEGLEVHEVSGGGDDDQEGEVEFTARYLVQGQLARHRERAVFKRVDGRWYYFDGEMVKARPVVRDGRKVGRNDPCPCKSGKKYKKCCGR